MSAAYEFTHRPDPKVILAALRVSPPFPKVRGQTRNKLLRILHRVLVVLGGLGIGYGGSELLTGTATLAHWSTGVGLALVYLSIFGSIFNTLPTYVRQVMSTRGNQGDVTLSIDESGVRSRGKHFRSHVNWAGFEGVGRSKLAVLLWFGGNRISIPFTDFDNAAQIDAFELDVKKWIEATR